MSKIISKVIEDVIFDILAKKFLKINTKNEGEGQK